MITSNKALYLFGDDVVFHHIGLAVDAIEEIGFSINEIITDPIQRVKIAFVEIGGCRIELLEPLEEGSPISGNLKKGNKLAHICFEVGDLKQALACARENNFIAIAHPVPAPAFSGRAIAWVFSPIWGLFEILERAAPSSK